MRFESIKAQGMGLLQDVDVDFTSMPGKLISVTGNVGDGKSSFIELLIGSLTRECPTRGSLQRFARTRDAFVETKFVNGKPWTVKHTMDSVSGGGESLVLDGNGKPAFDSAKRRSFDAWSTKHMPSTSLLLASQFKAQRGRGWLDLKESEQGELIRLVTGAERLEALAKLARTHANEAKSEATRLRGLLQGLEAVEVAEASAELTQADIATQDAEQALAKAIALDEKAKAYRVTLERMATIASEVATLKNKRANNSALLPEAEKIRAAAAGLAEAGELVRELDAEVASLSEKIAAIGGECREHLARWEDSERQAATDSAALMSIEALLAGESAIVAAAAAAASLREQIAAGEAEEALARQQIEALSATLLSGAEGRVDALRGGFSSIVELEPGVGLAIAHSIASASLEEDDDRAAELSGAPARIAAAKASLAAGQRQLAALRVSLTEAEALAAKAPGLEKAKADAVVVSLRMAEHIAKSETHAKAREASELKRAALFEERLRTVSQRATAKTKLDELTALASKAQHLAAAAAKIELYTADIERLEAELAKLRGVPAVPVDQDHVTPAETRLSACRARRERAALSLEQAKKTAEKRAAAETMLAAAERDLADWSLLADSLGVNGLQSAAVDAAVPELNELVNDLLHTCHGPRWTIAIEAARSSADGKKEIQGVTTTVLDSQHGDWRPGQTLSGGEGTIINEAISLALTMLACRASGAERPTLIRDESGSSLDKESGRAWIAMLRRAGDILDVDKILFVSHDPALRAMADGEILVAGGSVRVAA